MAPIPDSALAMALGLLMVTWAILAHMMASQQSRPQRQFLLDLLGEDEPNLPAGREVRRSYAGSNQSPVGRGLRRLA